jgi:8-oxo-dGTP diphosphatase
MLYLEKPENYRPKHVISICVIECDSKILLMKRQPHKFKGGMWDLPGGKLEPDEDPRDGIIREAFEETNIRLKIEGLRFVREVYIRYPEFDFTSNLFYYQLDGLPQVAIESDCHSEYGWFTRDEALNMDLVPDEAERIRLIIGNINKERQWK